MAKIKNADSSTNPGLTNIIDGEGRSEQDKLLTQFARKADLTLADAKQIIAGNTAGLNASKVATFGAAVADDYGDLDTFAIVYDSMAVE